MINLLVPTIVVTSVMVESIAIVAMCSGWGQPQILTRLSVCLSTRNCTHNMPSRP